MRAHGSQNFHEPVKSTGQTFSFVLIKNNSDKKTAFFFLREGVRRLKLLLSGVDIFQIVTLNFWLSRFCVLLQAWDRKDENKVRKLLSSPWKFSREGSFFVCYPMAVITVEPAGKTSFVYSCM